MNAKKKADFTCTPEELQKKIDDYFRDREKRNKPLTEAGLCLAVDIPYRRYRKIVGEIDDIVAGDAAAKDHPDLQVDHALILQKGVLRLMDYLQGDRDPNSILATKQAHLGGYTDKVNAKNDAFPEVHIRLVDENGKPVGRVGGG